MTKDEIIALIDEKIVGQGNQINAGSHMPNTLKGILALAGGSVLEELDDFEEFVDTTPYSEDDIVRRDGKLYVFTHGHLGEGDPEHVEQTNVFSILSAKDSAIEQLIANYHPAIPTVTISALTSSTMTAEQATAAGFTSSVIAMLQQAHSPVIEFSDMCVTLNAVEVISDDLVNQSGVIVHPEGTALELYKVLLSLNTNGSVTYTVNKLS